MLPNRSCPMMVCLVGFIAGVILASVIAYEHDQHHRGAITLTTRTPSGWMIRHALGGFDVIESHITMCDAVARKYLAHDRFWLHHPIISPNGKVISWEVIGLQHPNGNSVRVNFAHTLDYFELRLKRLALV